jgi:hypothetical protein
VNRDADIAHLEASLADSNGISIAVATATAKVIALAAARTAV